MLNIFEIVRSLELPPRHFADQRPNQANFRGDLRGDFRGDLGSPTCKSLHKLRAALRVLRWRQTRAIAKCDRFQKLAARRIGIVGKNHRLGDEGVARNGSMACGRRAVTNQVYRTRFTA